MNDRFGIEVIVSGGQTGTDRAALDFAIERRFKNGGFVPKGRIAEDGRISERYPNLRETKTADPAERTQLNVEDSDATLIITRGLPVGGSKLTIELATGRGKPWLHLNLRALSLNEAAAQARCWLRSIDCKRLNIAGPRASEDPQIYDITKTLLETLFGEN